MDEWVLKLGVGLAVLGFATVYFLLPKQMHVSKGVTAAGSVVKGVVMVVFYGGLAILLVNWLLSFSLDADIEACEERYGLNVTTDYDDEYAYCVDELNGRREILRRVDE